VIPGFFMTSMFNIARELGLARSLMQGRMFRSTFIYGASSALNAGVPFLLLPIITRALDPASYGIAAMFTTLVTFLGAFTGLSVHGAVNVRYFRREQFDLPNYIVSCLAILAVSTVLVAGVLAFAADTLYRFTELPRMWILVAAATSGAQFVIQVQLTLWQASERPLHYGALRIGQSLLDAGLSLLFIFGLDMLWVGRAGGQAMASLLVMAVALVLLYRSGWLKGTVQRDCVRNALHFGVPLIPHSLGAMLIGMIGRFMLTDMVGVADAGIYMVALQFSMVLSLLTDSFNRAFTPWLYKTLKKCDEGLKFRIVKYTYVYFAVVFILALLIGFSAPFVLPLFVGEKYRAASQLVIYLILGHAFNGMYFMVTCYVFYESKTAKLAIITLVSGVFNTLLSYFLIRANGVAGAAQGFMIAQALLFGGTWWLANRTYRMPWASALPWRRV
jgi:O-antigen/teichoic acid export membrane protein